jgi:hypothetical protein
MHTHMRKTELKEEEEVRQHDQAIKKREEELRIQKEQLENVKRVHHVLPLYTVVVA